LRSSGSMTFRSASVICSVVGITFIQAEPVSGHVGPSPAFFGGRPVTIGFRVPAQAPVDVIRAGSGATVRRYQVAAGRGRLTWDGLTGRGRAAPDGRYVIRIGGARAGSVILHGHYFPVRGPHWERGPIGLFGAPRSRGRTHEGFDVLAACGTPLAAARAGRVVKNVYNPVLYGNLVIVRGLKSHRDYWYAHLAHPSPFRRGARVRTGQRIGVVGATGNARSVGCHLHFEIHSRGRPIDPEPALHAWDRWS
jgi:murein DD-endopeptidase MepM/ murein hydrolase activator NlpD